jgi:hypothetical protein
MGREPRAASHSAAAVWVEPIEGDLKNEKAAGPVGEGYRCSDCFLYEAFRQASLEAESRSCM